MKQRTEYKIERFYFGPLKGHQSQKKLGDHSRQGYHKPKAQRMERYGCIRETTKPLLWEQSKEKVGRGQVRLRNVYRSW